jgi:hypothetical protein
MAVFRVEKTKDFTVMSNHHFRNRELSLKAKGLLSFMLSLSDEWDYTLEGLAKLNKDGVDSIRTAINELENAGYIERGRKRDEKGQLRDSEYIIYEQPILRTPTLDNPTSEEPILENPIQDNPMQENPTQLNIYKSKTKELNTNVIKYPSINQPEKCDDRWIDRYDKTITEIKEQIDYDSLVNTNDKKIVDEVVNIMADVMTVYRPKYKIEGEMIEREAVIHNFKQVTADKLDICLITYSRMRKKIGNTKAYWITVLYNIPLTSHLALSNMVNHDMCKGGQN